MILSQDDIKRLIKEPAHKADIDRGIQLRASALVHWTGDGVVKLFGQLLGVESQNDQKLKEALGKPVSLEITDFIFTEQNRFRTAQGAVERFDFGNDEAGSKQWNETKKYIWKGTGLESFMKDWLPRAMYTGMNDFLLIERPYKETDEEGKSTGRKMVAGKWRGTEDNTSYYAVHIPITVVHDFDKTGDRVEYLIYKYKEGGDEKQKSNAKYFRVIDDEKDQIWKFDGKEAVIDTDEETIPVIGGVIPVRQIGTVTERIDNDRVCISPIHAITPQLDLYVQFYAINSVSEAKNAYPLRWMWGKTCGKCQGEGTIVSNGHDVTCPDCGGFGLKARVEPGGVFIIPPVVEGGQEAITGAPAGVIETDTATPDYQKKTLQERKREIIFSALGSNTAVEAGMAKTATEAEMNLSPLEDRNATIATYNEAVASWMCDYICKQISPDYKGSIVRYGRKLNIRDENSIIAEIKEAKSVGMESSYVMSLHQELIMSKYRLDPVMMQRYLVLSELEPFPGYSIQEVSGMTAANQNDVFIKLYFPQIITKLEQSGDVVAQYNKLGYDLMITAINEIAANMKSNQTA